MRYRTSGESSSRSVYLLLSYAARYPEIATIRYDPGRQTIRLSFLVTGQIASEEYLEVKRKVLETLEVYHLLDQRAPATVAFMHEGLGELNSFSLERDVASLTPEELYTSVELMRQLFGGRLVTDSVDMAGEEDLWAQDEMIEEMLASMAERRSPSNLIAIRENGRLMFFQK